MSATGNVVERVRSISHRMGLSQYDIAETFDISQANISKILGGRVGLTPKMKLKFERGLADLRQRRESLAAKATKTASRPGPKPGHKITKVTEPQPGEYRAMSPSGLKAIIDKMLAGNMTGVVILGTSTDTKMKRVATTTRKAREKVVAKKAAKRAAPARRKAAPRAAAPAVVAPTAPVEQVVQTEQPAIPPVPPVQAPTPEPAAQAH